MKISDKMQENNNLQSEFVCQACNDAQLWDSFRQGDTNALANIYTTYFPSLFQYGVKLSADTDFVRDCIHDLIEDLFHYRKSVNDTNNIQYYMCRSLKNKILRHLKNQYPTDTVNGDSSLFEVAFDEKIQEQETIRHRKCCIRRALKQLPQRQKEVMYLCYIFDFNHREIAQLMKINYQAVRNVHHKAIKKLREKHAENKIF